MRKRSHVVLITHSPLGKRPCDVQYIRWAVRNRPGITYTILANGIHQDLKDPQIQTYDLSSRFLRKCQLIDQLIFTFRAIARIRKITAPDLLIFTYYKFVFLFRFWFPRDKTLLDIRTGSVGKRLISFKNRILRFNAGFFKNISINSINLGEKLIPKKPYHVIPQGGMYLMGESDEKKSPKIDFGFTLLYVGTFTERNLIKTVRAFHRFLAEVKERAHFYLIGDGEDYQPIRKYITDHRLGNRIHLTGRRDISQCRDLFSRAHFGLSYIPMVPKFDDQQPTKTYDYLVNGLPVIGTATRENRAVLHPDNSVLIDDDEDSIFAGLQVAWRKKDHFQMIDLVQNHARFRWEEVTREYYLPLIDQLLK